MRISLVFVEAVQIAELVLSTRRRRQRLEKVEAVGVIVVVEK